MTSPSYEQVMRTLNPAFLPTDEQASVITSESSAILVVAGAGSGKTATMTNRIAYQVAIGQVRPAQVLGLTFTRKAAGELAERTELALAKLRRSGLIPDPAGEETSAEMAVLRSELDRPTISTYNSFAADVAASYGMLVGADPAARLMTDAERWQVMNRAVTQWQGEDDASLQDMAQSSIVNAALNLAAALIDNRVSVDEAREFFAAHTDSIDRMNLDTTQFRGMKEASSAWRELRDAAVTIGARREVLPLVEAYFALKEELGLVEFADQISVASHVIERYPEIGREIAGRYSLVLLDEYQDTSVNQATFLKNALGYDISDTWRSVCAVGDPHQAIYGWRGASANALADFATQFGRSLGPVQHLELTTSFRNDRAILAAGNAVARTLHTSGVSVSPLTPRTDAGAGQVIAVRTMMRQDSYRAIARRIRDVFAEVHANPERTGASSQPEVAILCRKRKYQELAVSALDELGIPYEIVGGDSLIERPEILTIRAALNVIANPARNDQLMRLLTYAGANADTLRVLHGWSRELMNHQIAGIARSPHEESNDAVTPSHLSVRDEQSLVEALASLPQVGWHTREGVEVTPQIIELLTALATVVTQLREAIHMPIPDLIAMASSLLGIDVATATRGTGSQRVRTSLDSFIALGGAYAADHPGAPLTDFVTWLDAVAEKEHGGEEEAGEDYLDETVEVHPGTVQIMTIHSAKGLEWRDLVVIPEMVEGEFSASTGRISAWPQNSGIFPFPLRADYAYLPQFDVRSCADKFDAGEKYYRFKREELLDHENQERGRLAYVAFTRPVKELLLAGYAIRDEDHAKKLLQSHSDAVAKQKAGENDLLALIQPSTYMDAVTQAAERGEVSVVGIADIASADWPQELVMPAPSSLRADELRLLLPADAHITGLEPIPDDAQMADLPRWPQDIHRIQASQENGARLREGIQQDVDLLIAEWKERSATVSIERPYFTATDLVHLSENSEEFLAAARRPIPRRPSPAARSGTQLHALIAHHFERPATLDIDALLDVNEMPLDVEFLTSAEEVRLMGAFNESRWAHMPPIAVEQSVEIVVAGRIFRCTIDAVLDTSGDAELHDVTIVDWKTGRRPAPEQIESRELQLALYRLAWSRAQNIPLSSIDACFVYLKEPPSSRDLFAGRLSEEEIERRIEEVMGRHLR